jgi:LDH2 family malate/lactate/ureidoglycolate dehydrogenase
MDLAVTKAEQNGIGLVGARAPGGILGPFVARAVDAGMIGIAMSQSSPYVAPLGGYEPLLGNAPIAIGIPAPDSAPVILDMSLTETSASGVRAAAAGGFTVPAGSLLDASGNPTTDPTAFAAHDAWQSERGDWEAAGSLVPLGAGHKGYALVFVVNLLVSLLSDTSASWEVTEIVRGHPGDDDQRYGCVLVAVDAKAISGVSFDRTEAFIDAVKQAPRRLGVDEILYPGEKSQRLRRRSHDRNVVVIPRSHYDALVALAGELSLDRVLPPARATT